MTFAVFASETRHWAEQQKPVSFRRSRFRRDLLTGNSIICKCQSFANVISDNFMENSTYPLILLALCLVFFEELIPSSLLPSLSVGGSSTTNGVTVGLKIVNFIIFHILTIRKYRFFIHLFRFFHDSFKRTCKVLMRHLETFHR